MRSGVLILILSASAIAAEPAVSPIDLATALRLANAENPQLLLARQRVTESMAVRQLAAAQLLPNINAGASYNRHNGPLQQSNGNILRVNRESAYTGFGATAIGGGTVAIPGVQYNLNLGAAYYGYLAVRQRVTTATESARAVDNDTLRRVTLAYIDLARAQVRKAIVAENRTEAAEIARLTAAYATAGLGKKSDADRAAVELQRRDIDVTQAEADVITASARLCQLLNLDPTTRLVAADGPVVPTPLVPDTMPLAELLAVSLLQRPELAARRSDVQQALYELSLANALPFAPNVILGFSAGGFGGGSNLVPRPFDSLDGRNDFDVAVFWTFRNLGVGNVALNRAADSRVRQNQLRELETLNGVRTEVAEAHARVSARLQQIDAAERAVKLGTDAFREDLTRIKGGQGLPLECIDSLRLLARGRTEYLDAISDYNRAEVQLWVALGRPSADMLSRPANVGPRVFVMPLVMPKP